MLAAFGLASADSLPLELCGPASRQFPLAHVDPTRRRVFGGTPGLEVALGLRKSVVDTNILPGSTPPSRKRFSVPRSGENRYHCRHKEDAMLSEGAVAVLRFRVKGWRFPARDRDQDTFEELVDAGIM